MARLKDEYASRMVPELEKKLGTTNRMLVPRLQKIVINMGFGIVSKLFSCSFAILHDKNF